jgi:membrane protease YdiL (CAAX protease family)
VSFVVLIGLLALPAIAVQRIGVDYQWVIAYAVLISALTYWVYGRDKRRAENGEWRVPEARLCCSVFALAGGLLRAYPVGLFYMCDLGRAHRL